MQSTTPPILRHVRGQLIKCFAFGSILTFFVNVLQLISPFYFMEVYDRVLSSRNVDTLTMLTVLALGGMAAFGLLEFLRSRTFVIAADIAGRSLNVASLRASLTEQLKGRGVQSMLLVRDIVDLRNFLGSSAVGAPIDLAWTPLFLGMVALFHPAFALILGAAALVMLAIGLLVSRFTRSMLRDANEASGLAMARVASTLRHADAIEGLGMMPILVRRWQQEQEDALDLQDRAGMVLKALSALSVALRMGLQIVLIAVGVLLVLRNETSAGALLCVNLLAARILVPFSSLADNWRQWVVAQTAWYRIQAMLTNSHDGRQTIAVPKPAARLDVDRLVYVPPGTVKPVLRGVSFSIGPGEVLGVVGPSAAGKSTLARLLVGVWETTAGGIYLDGHNVFLWERESFGAAVGYLPQNVSLLDGTVRENIARMRPDADPRMVIAAARRAGVHQMIGRLPEGYDTYVGDNGYALSGGQRQRIALARALYGSPALLVLDEPNASLDAEGEQALRNAIVEAKRGGAAVVLIAHRPSIMQLADKLLVLRDGAMEQFGPRTDVIESISGASVKLPPNVARLSQR